MVTVLRKHRSLAEAHQGVMSKTVVIQKSGTTSTQNSISAIQTQTIENSAKWVPEDEVQLTELATDENGTYTPDVYYVKVNGSWGVSVGNMSKNITIQEGGVARTK